MSKYCGSLEYDAYSDEIIYWPHSLLWGKMPIFVNRTVFEYNLASDKYHKEALERYNRNEPFDEEKEIEFNMKYPKPCLKYYFSVPTKSQFEQICEWNIVNLATFDKKMLEIKQKSEYIQSCSKNLMIIWIDDNWCGNMPFWVLKKDFFKVCERVKLSKQPLFIPKSLFQNASEIVKKEFSTDLIQETLPKSIVEQVLQ